MKDQVTKAEIIWHHLVVLGKQQCSRSVPFNVSRTVTLLHGSTQKDKNSNVVTYALCPGFQHQLVSDVKNCAFLLCLFCSFEQGSSRIWTRVLRSFINRPIALAQGGEEFG